jgi:hypothetical protein
MVLLRNVWENLNFPVSGFYLTYAVLSAGGWVRMFGRWFGGFFR